MASVELIFSGNESNELSDYYHLRLSYVSLLSALLRRSMWTCYISSLENQREETQNLRFLWTVISTENSWMTFFICWSPILTFSLWIHQIILLWRKMVSLKSKNPTQKIKYIKCVQSYIYLEGMNLKIKHCLFKFLSLVLKGAQNVIAQNTIEHLWSNILSSVREVKGKHWV